MYIGGAMQYDELRRPARTGGRSLRSTDAGVNFTDMTVDDQKGRLAACTPTSTRSRASRSDSDIVFIGDDGGIDPRRRQHVRSTCREPAARAASAGRNLTDCTNWLSNVPTTIYYAESRA